MSWAGGALVEVNVDTWPGGGMKVLRAEDVERVVEVQVPDTSVALRLTPSRAVRANGVDRGVKSPPKYPAKEATVTSAATANAALRRARGISRAPCAESTKDNSSNWVRLSGSLRRH